MMFISVLLPAPFWPIRPRTRPRPSAERHVADRMDAEEGLGDRVEREDRLAHRRALAREEAGARDVERRRGRMMPPFTTSM